MTLHMNDREIEKTRSSLYETFREAIERERQIIYHNISPNTNVTDYVYGIRRSIKKLMKGAYDEFLMNDNNTPEDASDLFTRAIKDASSYNTNHLNFKYLDSAYAKRYRSRLPFKGNFLAIYKHVFTYGEQTESMCMKVVATFPEQITNVRLINRLSHLRVMKTVLERDYTLIGLFKNPALDVCVLAYRINKDALALIKDKKIRLILSRSNIA